MNLVASFNMNLKSTDININSTGETTLSSDYLTNISGAEVDIEASRDVTIYANDSITLNAKTIYLNGTIVGLPLAPSGNGGNFADQLSNVDDDYLSRMMNFTEDEIFSSAMINQFGTI